MSPAKSGPGVGLPYRASGSEIVEALGARAVEASDFLKVLSHEGRLKILCHLATRERSVTELEGLLGARQAAVSQQLARLRLEGFVSTRREGGRSSMRSTTQGFCARSS